VQTTPIIALADPWGATVDMAFLFSLSVGLASSLQRADGHLAFYSTYHANILVELLNLLSPDVFSGVNGQKCINDLGSTPDPAGELTAFLQSP